MRSRSIRALGAGSLRAGTLGAFLAALLPACEVPPPESRNAPDPVLAEIDGRALMRSDLDERLAGMPAAARSEFRTGAGRARLLKQMIEEEILYRAAVDEGIANDDSVRRLLDEHRRRVLVQAYLERKRSEASRVPEDEIRGFYESHLDEYTTPEAVRVRIILNADSARVAQAVALVAEGKIPFDEAAVRSSDHDAVIDARGLLPSWVVRDRAVDWLGNHPEFHRVAFSLPLNEISPVFHTAKGWQAIRVEEKREASVRPLDSVRPDIEGRLFRGREALEVPRLLEDLRARYGVVEHTVPGHSPDELFAEAQGAADARERVALYEELLERYPDHEKAIEARFMLGFLLAEEFGDHDAAEIQFRRLVEEHPDSELAQSARWMLSSKSRVVPALEGETPPPPASQEESP